MKVWPRDMDMRGKRVRLNDKAGTVVEIPKDADRHVDDVDEYVCYEYSAYVFHNIDEDAPASVSDIVEIIEPADVPDNAGAEKRGAELYGRGEAERDAPDNAELRIVDCCASCRHFSGSLCNEDNSCPDCGALALIGAFGNGDPEAVAACEELMRWSAEHKVEPFNVCDRYERMLDEEDDDATE